MYQGRADAIVSVYDMTDDGAQVFRRSIRQFEFPKTGVSNDIPRARFEQRFLYVLSRKIANYFYDYELKNEVAKESPIIE